MGSKNKCMFGHMARDCVQPGSEFRHGAVRHRIHLLEFHSVQFQDQDITRRSHNILGLELASYKSVPLGSLRITYSTLMQASNVDM